MALKNDFIFLIKNILFYTAWFCFFVALVLFYLVYTNPLSFNNHLDFIIYFIISSLCFMLYYIISKRLKSFEIYLKDRFYSVLKYLSFYVMFIVLVNALFNLYVKNDFILDLIYAVLFFIIYKLFSKNVVKNQAFALALLLVFCAYKYYDYFLKQPNELIMQIIKAKKINFDDYFLVDDINLIKALNENIKDKSPYEVYEYFKEFKMLRCYKNANICYKNIVFGKTIFITLIYKNKRIEEIYYKANS